MGNPLLPGQTVTRAYIEALRQGVVRGGQVAGGMGVSATVHPGGLSIAPDPVAEWRENSKRMKLMPGAGICPRYGLVHICYDGWAEQRGAERPGYSGWMNLGVYIEGAESNEYGWVQYQGTQWVYADVNTFPTYLPLDDIPVLVVGRRLWGQRLGCRKNSFIAQWDESGPLIIECAEPVVVQGDPYIWTTTAGAWLWMVKVRITQARHFADSVYCRRYDL